ncbi:MAG: SRPBCC domain-containing protein [Myxococcota bacterium]
MRAVETERVIAAPPTRVWDVLTDAEALTRPGTGIQTIDGEIRDGASFSLTAEVSPRTFRLTVAAFDAPRRMVWKGGMPLGLFTGERTFTLEEDGDGGCRVRMREVFTGLIHGRLSSCRTESVNL